MLSERCAVDSQKRGPRREQRRDSKRLDLGVVRREDRERSPGGGEDDVGVETAAEQLEVVAKGEGDAHGDEHRQTGPDSREPDHAERDGPSQAAGGGSDEEPARDGGTERSAVELIEGVGAHADGEQEGEEGCGEPADVEAGSDGGADGDVGEVPERVGRVEEHPPVGPPTPLRSPRRGVEGGRPRTGGVAHGAVVPTAP